jgi:subtilase family serine protease
MSLPRKVALLVFPSLVLATMVAGPAGASPGGAPLSLPSVTVPSLPSVMPGLARLGKVVASVTSATPIDFSVLVKGPHDAELPALASAVSDPTSTLFRHFLTRSQIISEYDPPAASIDTVVAGLKALGITVIRTSSDGRMVDAQATAGLLSTVLGLRFAYVKAASYATERVALNQPLFPAALRPLIADVIGLSATPVDDFATPPPVVITNAPTPAYFNARPCAAYFNQSQSSVQPTYKGKELPVTICGYTPTQIRDAYRVPETNLTGQGVRIGIVDDYSSPTMLSDVNKYSALNGLPPLPSSHYIDNSDLLAQHVPEIEINTPPSVLGTIPGESPQEWSKEQSLDVEMEHTMAPDATIEYYGGDQGLGIQPLEAEFSIAIAEDQAQFISDSWGIEETDELVTPADFEWMSLELELGAIEGIGASFSTGDDGDNIEANDVKAADFPASDDMGTAVGGTTLVIGPNNGYYGETYWGTREEPETKAGTGWDPTPKSEGTGPATGPGTLAGAGGGGVSDEFAEPSWQKPIVPKDLTTQIYTSPDGQNTNNVTSPGRVVPDISLVADSTTGVLIGQTQTDVDGVARYSQFRLGGTSVSSPLFAGLMALAIQHNGGKDIGFVDPAMYKAYVTSPNGFRDPSLGRNLVTERPDFTNTQNPASPVIYHLRLLGQLSTLHDLKGYDDSTGLGTPCASVFIAAIVAPSVPQGAAPGCGDPLATTSNTANGTNTASVEGSANAVNSPVVSHASTSGVTTQVQTWVVNAIRLSLGLPA